MKRNVSEVYNTLVILSSLIGQVDIVKNVFVLLKEKIDIIVFCSFMNRTALAPAIRIPNILLETQI